MSNHAFNCLLAKVMIVASDAGFSYFRLETHHNVCGDVFYTGKYIYTHTYILGLVKVNDDPPLTVKPQVSGHQG